MPMPTAYARNSVPQPLRKSSSARSREIVSRSTTLPTAFGRVSFPNGLSLRQPLEDKNICCMIVNQLRSADTPANVCPSIHVSSTIGILFVLFHSEKLKNYRKLKATMLVLGTFICISTVVIDQHSVVDAVCGMMLSAVLFYLVQLSEVPDQVTVFEEVKR